MIERPATLTETMVFSATPVFVAAIHTAEHGCLAFSVAADHAETAVVFIAMHALGYRREG